MMNMLGLLALNSNCYPAVEGFQLLRCRFTWLASGPSLRPTPFQYSLTGQPSNDTNLPKQVKSTRCL